MKYIIIIIFLSQIFMSCIFGDIVEKHYEKKYNDYQKIYISDYGNFKVPKNWIVTQNEVALYITDKPIDIKEYKIYLIGIKGENGSYLTHYQIFEEGSIEERKNNIPHYDLFENVKYLGSGRGAISSYSSSYIVRKYIIDDKIEERFNLCLGTSDKILHLFAWDNIIDEKIIKKIIDSWSTQ